jgi:hypothetical protein
MKRLVLSLLVAGFLATGCGHPLIPAADIRPAPTAKKIDTTVAAIGPAAVAGKPLLGVNLYALSNYPAAEVAFDGARVMDYIKSTLKATAVNIVWNLYAPSRSSNIVRATSNTLSAANVKILTGIAKRDGLKVFYRPLIFIVNQPKRPWEGKITPASPAKWFDNYYSIELPYVKVAEQLGVSEFVVETEMHAMNRNPGWTPYFRRLAKVYHGVLSYASWDGDFFGANRHLLPDVPAVGMDFYEPMPKLRPAASEAKVFASWERWLKKVPASVLKRTTIQEIGIQARAGAYGDPANLRTPGKLAEQVQANWFTAGCKAVHQFHMRGLFFWKVDLTDNPAHPAKSLSTFEGKKGAKAIAACTSILR